MDTQKLQSIIDEVKQIDKGESSNYEILVSVLRAIDDTEKRMQNVISYPSPPTKK
ncbi:hypothetical protein [Enterobacter asburiae]|uniref:hypothetical protein n=1 Tax=Enterobacter asburiae TaxID=61645 RepID=UPI00163C501F|nr:hypothetical protein [Enterobacter asburiae]